MAIMVMDKLPHCWLKTWALFRTPQCLMTLTKSVAGLQFHSVPHLQCRHNNVLHSGNQGRYPARTSITTSGGHDYIRRWNLCRQYSSKQETIMNVFDRKTKRIQRNRTALMDDYKVFDYMKDEIGYRTADRVCDVKRLFNVAADLGCGRGHVAEHIYKDMVGTLYQTDIAEMVLSQSKVSPEVPTYKIHADEEFLPFADNSLDLVTSSLSLHWVNDLPGTFRQVLNALKKDGCFIGAMFGGETLYQLRTSLQLAETERESGLAAHVSPFTSTQDLGGLLNRAGFVMLTIDIDEITVNYPSMFELMDDLKGMGESNCAWSRRSMIHRDTLMAASAIYKEMYSKPDQEGVPATFQVINFIAWKPHPSQKGPAKRGSGEVSLKDLHNLDKLAKDLQDAKNTNDDLKSMPSVDKSNSVDQLSKDIDTLRQSVTDKYGNESDDDEKNKS